MALTKTALLKAILYADLFDFPLTKEELSVFAVEEKASSANEVERTIGSLKNSIETKDGFYFLKGRDEVVSKRVRRRENSKKKLDLARILSVYMSFIPSVHLIGVTGGVAAGNAEKDDDIDFIVIVAEGTIWPTRLVLLVMLHFLGRRRARDARVVSDMACLNLFLDKSTLSLQDGMRSIYTAHEIVQMHPLFSRGSTYEAFIGKNDWVYTYLPQAKKHVVDYRYTRKAVKVSFFSRLLSNSAVVQLSRFLQRSYMGKRSVDSTISDTMMGFYPQSFHADVLKLYEERLKKFSLKT